MLSYGSATKSIGVVQLLERGEAEKKEVFSSPIVARVSCHIDQDYKLCFIFISGHKWVLYSRSERY